MAGHENIALHAYRLWEERGRPEGRELEIWLEAEAEISRQNQDWTSEIPDESPALTNFDRTSPPDQRRQARDVRSGRERTSEPAGGERPQHFIVVLDRAHLRIYEVKESDGLGRAPQFELAESFDLPAGPQRYTDRDTDQAGRFRTRIGPGGASIDERLPMRTEHERRLAVELAEHLGNFLEEHEDATWDYAAGPQLHHAVLDRLPPAVRSRLELALTKELIHQSPAELRAYFTS